MYFIFVYFCRKNGMNVITYIRKHSLLHYFVVFVLLIVAYCLFGVFSCSLPDNMVRYRVKRASSSLAAYGNYPRSVFDLDACQQDCFTEALMLNQVYCVDRTKPLESSMKVCFKMSTLNFPGDLWLMTHEEVNWNEYNYARYWFGTTFLTRILLLFFNYAQIQWLFFAISTLLMFLFGIRYLPRAGIRKTVAMLLSWLLVYGFMWQFSLQFTPVFILTLLSCILVVRFNGDNRCLGMLFFVIASLTCYFDVLTVPFLSLGCPLLVWLSLQDDRSLKTGDVWAMVKWAFLWLAGFAFTWVLKWAVASAVLGYNVFQEASDAMSMRTGVAEDFNRWDAVTRNMGQIPWAMVIFSMLGLCVGLPRRFQRPSWWKVGLYLLLALAPYMWYGVLSNHSYLHFWFTYRLQAVTFCALFLALCCFERPGVRRSGRKRFPAPSLRFPK